MASADSSRGTHTETSARLFLAETQSVNGGGARSDKGDEDAATVLPWLRRKRRKQEFSLPSNSNQARTRTHHPVVSEGRRLIPEDQVLSIPMRLARQLIVGLWDRLRLAWGYFLTIFCTLRKQSLQGHD